MAIRDIDQVDFSGRIVNAETGAWVADGGSRIFFDALAPDSSYLTTYMLDVRHSAYIHGAGRTDFQTGDFSGLDAFDPRTSRFDSPPLARFERGHVEDASELASDERLLRDHPGQQGGRPDHVDVTSTDGSEIPIFAYPTGNMRIPPGVSARYLVLTLDGPELTVVVGAPHAGFAETTALVQPILESLVVDAGG